MKFTRNVASLNIAVSTVTVLQDGRSRDRGSIYGSRRTLISSPADSRSTLFPAKTSINKGCSFTGGHRGVAMKLTNFLQPLLWLRLNGPFFYTPLCIIGTPKGQL